MKAFQLTVALAAMFAITSSSFAGDAKKTAPAPAPRKATNSATDAPPDQPVRSHQQLRSRIWLRPFGRKPVSPKTPSAMSTRVEKRWFPNSNWPAPLGKLWQNKSSFNMKNNDRCNRIVTPLSRQQRDFSLNDVARIPVSVGDTSIVDVEAVDDRISLLIAEVDGFGATLIKMRAVKRTASRTLETLKQRINDMDACVVTIDTQLLLIKALRLPNDSEVLAQQIFLICPNLPETATEHENRMIQWKAENCRQEQKRQSNAPAPPGEKRSSAPKKTQCETPAKKKTRKLFAQSN